MLISRASLILQNQIFFSIFPQTKSTVTECEEEISDINGNFNLIVGEFTLLLNTVMFE